MKRVASTLLLLACLVDANAATIVVTTTGSSDAGCTLEDAIVAANQNLAVGACAAGQAPPVVDRIAFAIPPFDGSVKTISSDDLPAITGAVLIDGLTQPGSSCSGGFPTLRVAVTGPADAFGLQVGGADVTVRGVAIYGFMDQIFAFSAGSGAQRLVLQCNVIGMFPDGTTAGANGSSASSRGVVLSNTGGNLIGTDGDGVNDAAEGNWIAGNARQITISSVIDPISGNRVSGNRIGTNAAGTGAPIGSIQHYGIWLKEGVGRATIGGDGVGASDALEANVVAYQVATTSGDGGGIVVSDSSTGVTIRGNSIFANTTLDIDLAEFNDEGHIEPNDPLDADTGPNEFQNRPTIGSVTRVGASVRIVGALDSAASADYEIELFGNARCNASGYGPGERPIASTAVHTDASGHADFDITALDPAAASVTALATDIAGNTSEFSECASVVLLRDGFEG